MRPVEINKLLNRDVLGQEEALRFVSVAMFKHLKGERFGNLMLIGNSGTGKTTIMRAMERFYREHKEFEKYCVVVIINANTFATEEGVIETSRLFLRLEERARQLLGDDATADDLAAYMEHATICMDETDKVSGMVGGKPYVTGLNIQQALLTLIEGENIDHTVTVRENGQMVQRTLHINTGKMLFLCAGAFETLYDQVFKRVTSPTSRVKLPTETVLLDGEVQIREYFALRHHFKQEDLFDYGMVPQFLARFDNSIILEDLHAGLLKQIFLEPDDALFKISKNFFTKYDIELEITDGAVTRIAHAAAEARRIGARALKEVYGRVIKPYEFDPFSHEEVVKNGEGHKLVITEEIVTQALKPRI